MSDYGIDEREALRILRIAGDPEASLRDLHEHDLEALEELRRGGLIEFEGSIGGGGRLVLTDDGEALLHELDRRPRITREGELP